MAALCQSDSGQISSDAGRHSVHHHGHLSSHHWQVCAISLLCMLLYNGFTKVNREAANKENDMALRNNRPVKSVDSPSENIDLWVS